jgi:hypothetical protein
MIVEEHRDRDPEEAAYRRHGSIMARAPAVVLLDFSSSFVPSESPSIGFGLLVPRRGAGVVERGSLENWIPPVCPPLVDVGGSRSTTAKTDSSITPDSERYWGTSGLVAPGPWAGMDSRERLRRGLPGAV